MTVTSMHPMSLETARSWLATIGYDSGWTLAELQEATARLSADDRQRTVAALRIAPAACRQEAHGLETEVA